MVGIRLSDEEIERVDQRAEQGHTTRSETIRRAINAYTQEAEMPTAVEILTQLNTYTGGDIWGDVITKLGVPMYGDAHPERFALDAREYRYDHDGGWWYEVPRLRIRTAGGRPTIHPRDVSLLARIARAVEIHEPIRVALAAGNGDAVGDIIDGAFPEFLDLNVPYWDAVIIEHLEWLVSQSIPLDQAPHGVQPA